MKTDISDRAYFLSQAFSQRIKNYFQYACKTIGRNVPLIHVSCEGRKGDAAYTDGRTLTVNLTSRRVEKAKTRESKFLLILGLYVHEFGHYRFTDFPLLHKIMDAAAAGDLYPPPSKTFKRSSEYKRCLAELKEVSPAKLANALATIHNILEDGYIEEACFRTLTGKLADALAYVRQAQWEDFWPLSKTLSECKAGRLEQYDLMRDVLLQYAKWRKTKAGAGSKETEDFLELLAPIFQRVDEVVLEDDSERRASLCNEVFVLMWDAIAPRLRKGAQEGNERPHEAETAIPKGDTQAAPPSPAELTGQSGSTYSASTGDALESIRTAAQLLERDVRTEKEQEEAARRRLGSLEDSTKDIDFTPIHQGYPMKVIRQLELQDSAEADVDAFFDKYAKDISLLTRKLGEVFKTRQQEQLELTGCYSGPKFDASKLVRRDYRYFSKTLCPIPAIGISIVLLIDESASMSGRRIEAAKATAFILYLVCQNLGIPCAVIGHTETFASPTVLFEVYADFEATDRMDAYRILKIHHKENNRDGAALAYAGHQLLNRPEKTKLLINITDGAPLADRYCGAIADQDTRRTAQELRRQGVTIFSATIGSDREQISAIYEDGFLDIGDLSSMPQQLVTLIKRYIPAT